MEFLPVFLDIRGRKVLVDGGGTVAARRVERALDAGAHVEVFAPEPEEELSILLGRERLTHQARLPGPEDVTGCAVVYGASEDPARDEPLHRWAQEQKVLCNIADRPEFCDFITPSIVDRAPITVAISTGGTAPIIARILRARIEATLPPGFGRLAEFVGAFRQRIMEAVPDAGRRRHFWERMIEGPVGDFFLAGDRDRAEAQFAADLEAERGGEGHGEGEVYLVGAGPGDPDLLTFRALRLMQRADVVLYDRLIGPEILSLVRRDAERIYVGKRSRDHVMKQEDISDLLVRLAQEGKRVLRLKGGDPFIFGRGGEEIARLAGAGIGFQVVPGVTAAAGCGAYAGIPLTHRDHAQSALFVTAHGKDGVLDLDWEVLIRPAQTVAVYMGLGNLPVLVAGFLRHGVSDETPIAVVENGTLETQKVVTGTFRDIVAKVEADGIKGPAVIIIGTVVRLRDTLNWVHHGSRSRHLDIRPGNPMGV
ncbi:uroporphyrinogen-III C-methyltransferase [Aquicoccus sp. SCR17]|nr:uroporphyrinogen-III C-methyltransferase [Carideicomes alvinocaridis]